ncbi:YfhO family protein [Segetibacter koreensis]|uniref:YfhO family protein n=1 Tax=Segetibacter koreensis TaxID=398037 RepID=UPI00036501D5|nr:YfhO family protein [Segetibacter koreensis]
MTLQPAKLKPYFLLLVILLLAFLPVSTFYFGMKNDAFSDNFPNKYFFTEAIHSGFLPLWNPYLNFGFPIYADPGFAFWNPITWFFGVVVGYNAYTLTIEVLLYIYIAGISMYRLGKYFNFTCPIAITLACTYMCSGFFSGELQHINFLTAAAFLPFLLQQFLVLFNKPNLQNAILFSLAIYMTFAGGHPAMPIGTVYFLVTLTIAVVIIFSKMKRESVKVFLQYYLLSIFIFILLYSPAIYSIGSIINEYRRGAALAQFGETAYGFSPASYLSFLFPFSTVKDASFLTDDLSMRNVFFSLAGFAFVLCQLKNKNYLVRSLLLSAIVMLILSSGGYIKGVLYSCLPLLQYIRTNGEFRIFSILCFCCIAGFGLNELEINPGKIYVRYRSIIMIFLVISLSVILFTSAKSFETLPHLFSINDRSPITAIKAFITKLTFYNTLLISAVVQFIVVLLLLSAKTNTKKIAFIIIADLVINSIAYLPFTGVGTVTLSKIQEAYNTSKKGVIIPPLVSVKNIDTFSGQKTGLVGSSSFYNKKIGITRLTDYPSYFSNTENYFKSGFADTINNLPYVFLKKNIADHINTENHFDTPIAVDFFSPQKIHITVNVSQPDSLVFLQNHYKFWKAKVDGRPAPVNKSFITFMSVPVDKGRHLVEFYYEDRWLIVFVILSISTFITLIIYLLRKPLVSQLYR